MTSSISFILVLTTPCVGAGSSFGVLRARSVMVGGASLLPIDILGPSRAPAELPSVKRPGSRCAEVDAEGVAPCGGDVPDLSGTDVGVGNLAFNSNGAIGADVEDPI